MPNFLFLRPISSHLATLEYLSLHAISNLRHDDVHETGRSFFSILAVATDAADRGRRRWRRAGRFHPDKDHMVQSLSLRRRRAVLAHPPRQADTKDKRWRMSPTLIRISCFYPLVPWKALKSTRLAPEAGPNICIFGPIPTPSRSNCLSLGEERAPMQTAEDACMKRGADKRGSEGLREGERREKTFLGG